MFGTEVHKWFRMQQLVFWLDHMNTTIFLPRWTLIIGFKMLLQTCKILNGMAPSYLSDNLNPYVSTGSKCSQGTCLSSVHKVKKKPMGEPIFSFCTLWNRLPLDIKLRRSRQRLRPVYLLLCSSLRLSFPYFLFLMFVFLTSYFGFVYVLFLHMFSHKAFYE